jgi:hypothetical protein
MALALSTSDLAAQDLDFTATRAEVDFSKQLQVWDGFGFNYVETAHTYDYGEFTQEYGGFSLLDEQEKQEIVKLVRDLLDSQGLQDIGVTPGEPSNWYRFVAWGYANAFVDDPVALRDLGLITSHGFYNGGYGRWFGEHASAGIDRLREKRPDLHAWVTSTSWSKMDARNIKEHHGNIYTAKVNAIIPWAGIQRPPHWVGGDPNPGSAFTVSEDGSYAVRRGYYFYKQVTRAGQPGMAVARTSAMDSETAIIGFASNGTRNPDTFVVINLGGAREVNVNILGSAAKTFQGFRTTQDEKDLYSPIGTVQVKNGAVLCDAPAGSVTTFFAKPSTVNSAPAPGP